MKTDENTAQREMTLQEVVARLPECHRSRAELAAGYWTGKLDGVEECLEILQQVRGGDPHTLSQAIDDIRAIQTEHDEDRAPSALTPDSGKVLVSVPELMLLRDTIRELLDVQNGCPLPKYKEMFDAANEQALVMEAWLNGRLAAKIKEASDANE